MLYIAEVLSCLSVRVVFHLNVYLCFPKPPKNRRNFSGHEPVGGGHVRAAKKPSTDGVSLDYFLSELSDDDSTSW